MNANPEHLMFLLECMEDWLAGYGYWNDWREANLEVVPQLSGIDFQTHYKNYSRKTYSFRE